MDATDRHNRPREAAATLRAHWAWYRDGVVPACSAGVERRTHFERLVRPTLDEHAPPDWVAVTTTGREDPFVALTLRDADGVRYFTAPYAEIAESGASYAALWHAFRGIDLPTDRERPLRVRLPNPPAPVTVGDFDWFAGVAACVLAGPIVVTGAERLDTRARFELLDRVAALLPYGCRAGLRFATSLGPGGRLRPHLAFTAFAATTAPGTPTVALDGAPPVPGPGADAARAYLRELIALRRRFGLDALTGALATLREPAPPAAGTRLAELLAEAGRRADPSPPERAGDGTAPLAPVRADADDDRPAAVLDRLLTGDGTLAGPVAERWRAEDGDEVTRDMAAALRTRPDGLAIGWRTALAADRGDRLVHVLLGPVPPILPTPTPAGPAAHQPPRGVDSATNGTSRREFETVSPEALVADLCRLLGPAATTDVPALYDALWNHPVVLRRLLDTAGGELRGWLDVIRPWDERAPEWLAPYALLAGERLRPAEIPPAEAVFTLRVAGRSDADTVAAVVHDLWPTFVTLAEDRADPAAQGLAALLGRPLGPAAPIGARVRADVLRLALGGAAIDGPHAAADLLTLRREPVAQGRFAGWVAALVRTGPTDAGLLGDLVRAGDPQVTAAVAAAVVADPGLGDLPGLDHAWWAAVARARPELAARAASGWFRHALRGADADTVARVWAGEIVDGPAGARRELYLHEVGRWWEAVDRPERDRLLPGLERELTARGLDGRLVRGELRAIRLLIAGHAWGPEAAARVVEHEQDEFDSFRRHLKRLRAALKHGDTLRALAVPVVLALLALLVGTPAGDSSATPRPAAARAAIAPGAEPPDPFGADRLIAALGADRVGVNYVVLVDASASMSRTGRYDAVKAALPGFLATLTAHDRVALVTFDTTAVEYGNGLEPVTDPAAMVARLPAARTTEATPGRQGDSAGAADAGPGDLHAALERALTVLRTSAPNSVDGVLLLSDAARDSIGPDLRKDFDRLRDEGRAVEGFAIPLASDSSAGPALQRVLPDARTLRDNPAAPGTALDQARTALRLRNAALIADADKGKGVQATWLMPSDEEPDAVDCRSFKPVPDGARLDLSAGRELCLRLTATTARVPLQVTSLRVDGVGVVGLRDGAPLLAPGQPVYFSVNLAAKTHRTDGMWKDAGHYDAKARVFGEVRTPLAEAFKEHLPDTTLAIEPGVSGPELAYRGDERVDLSWWPWLLAGLGTLTFLGVVWFGWARVRPWLLRRRGTAKAAP